MENPITTAAPEASLYEKNKLRIAGALNALGDVTFFAEGLKDRNPFIIAAGACYTAGTVVLALFGFSDKNRQVKELSERAAEFVNTHSTHKESSLESTEILRNRATGVFADADRFLRRYTAQVLLWFYTAGAAIMTISGIKGYFFPAAGKPRKNLGDLLVGSMSLLVKTASMLTPEKTGEEAEKEKATGKGLIAWFKEKPMRIFGYGSMLTEGFWGYRTYERYKGKQAWKLGAAATGSYVLADLVAANTNKDAANAVGKMSQDEQSKLENMMAETISYETEEKRELLSSQAANFLTKESIVNGSGEQLRDSLLTRANKLWAERNKEVAPAEAQRA